MKTITKIATCFYTITFISVNSFAQPNWAAIKASAAPFITDTSEYGTPFIQPLNAGGWEDGIYISRNGLNLYGIYLPMDYISWSEASPVDQANYHQFIRGSLYGMDTTQGIHGDILIAQRPDLQTPFSTWTLSNLSRPAYTEGAPNLFMSNDSTVDWFMFTSNDDPPGYKNNIRFIQNTSLNPSGLGTNMPVISTPAIEDNPHMERLSATDLVLFFDNHDPSGNPGGTDIFYTTSNDNGTTWDSAKVANTISVPNYEETQPHLWQDTTGQWWIYFTTVTDTVTLELGIFRMKQQTPGDWNSWTGKELVIGRGNTLAVGEPTLTKWGDISFLVAYMDNVNGTSTDKYDADPWFLPRKGSPLSTAIKEAMKKPQHTAFPNPFTEMITIRLFNPTMEKHFLKIYDTNGRLVKSAKGVNEFEITRGVMPSGMYFYQILNSKGIAGSGKLIAE